MWSVWRRFIPRFDQWGVVVQSFYVLCTRLWLQETTADRIGSPQSQTEQPILFLGRYEYCYAGKFVYYFITNSVHLNVDLFCWFKTISNKQILLLTTLYYIVIQIILLLFIYFKAYQSNNEISKKITLPLAERMVQKYINEEKIDAEQEIQLYLMILDMQVNLMLINIYISPTHYCLCTELDRKKSLKIQSEVWNILVLLWCAPFKIIFLSMCNLNFLKFNLYLSFAGI